MTAYAFTGAGVGLAATPASRALMSSVPLNRSGMGSAFLDLTRDFGGAILQAMLGGILAATYSAHIRDALTSLTPAQASQVSTAAAQEMTASYAGAAQVATGYPAQAAHAITSTAAAAFTDGKSLALASALGCTLIGLVLVLWKFPGKAAETAFYQSVATTGASADG